MIGCHAKLKVDLGIWNQSILIGWGLHASGISIIVCTIIKITHLPRQSKATNLTSSTLIYKTNRKHHNTTYKTQMIQIIA